jgi:DNA-directed RNA polymerase subunit RPC12/RpoP
MTTWVRGVACPRCFKIIYTLERGEGTDWVHSGAPLGQDEHGKFVRCPECNTAVRHRRAHNLPGFGYEVGS